MVDRNLGNDLILIKIGKLRCLEIGEFKHNINFFKVVLSLPQPKVWH